MVFSTVFIMCFKNAIIITLLMHTVWCTREVKYPYYVENQTLAALCKAKIPFYDSIIR